MPTADSLVNLNTPFTMSQTRQSAATILIQILISVNKEKVHKSQKKKREMTGIYLAHRISLKILHHLR